MTQTQTQTQTAQVWMCRVHQRLHEGDLLVYEGPIEACVAHASLSLNYPGHAAVDWQWRYVTTDGRRQSGVGPQPAERRAELQADLRRRVEELAARWGVEPRHVADEYSRRLATVFEDAVEAIRTEDVAS